MNNNKRKRSDDDQPNPRVGTKVPNTGTGHGPSTSAFHYDTGRQTGGQLSHQVKYGPGIGFSPIERGVLHDHYNDKKVTSRFTQYDANRNTYVQSAVGMGRGLTLQERDVQKGRDPGATSINHIIASGTGQHALNRSTLEFVSTGSPMHQAAAIGRMRGFAREIMREETGGEGYGKVVDTSNMTPQQAFVAKRNAMSKDLLKAFEGGNVGAYKQYMKHTFDSTGNLRLGHGSGNSRVSTGFDMPLDSQSQPTQRGQRLLKAYDIFGYQDMMKDEKIGKRNAAGLFTTNQKGSKLSSSRQVKDDTVDHHRRFF
jgi:hypothetical protein